MVFIYLPIYFSIGVILFFILFFLWRWWSKAHPREDNQPRPGAELQGGAQGPPTGNWTGLTMIFLAVTFVVGLVAFALGRATLPKGVFATDFPEGWGPLGFEIPAIVVGALAASFFMGSSTRPKRAAEASAKDGAEDEWLRLDRSRALLLAASALFLAFAALQYDYNLLGEVTKFSAGPVVSLELAQPVAKTNESSDIRLSTNLVAAAQPRTNSILFVTSKLKQLSEFPDEDDRVGQIFTGVSAPTYSDKLLDNIKTIITGCVSPLGNMLLALQDNHHSEFPSVNGIAIAAADAPDADAKDQQTGPAKSERIVLMSSLLIRRLYDGISKFKDDGFEGSGHKEDQEYVKTVASNFADALRYYEASIKPDFELLGKKDSNSLPESCADDKKNAELLSGLGTPVSSDDLEKD